MIKIYDEKSNQGYILEVDVEHPKHLHNLHSDLTFFPERTKENVKRHEDIKLVMNKKRRGHLVSKPNYQKTKWFSKKLPVTGIE